MEKPILKTDYKHWQTICDMIDQCIHISLNLSQSGHPGGSLSKVPVFVTTLLSGIMKWDIRNPQKTFSDRFILGAGHTIPLVYSMLAVFNEALRRKYEQTGDKKYSFPLGRDFTLLPEDLLTLRQNGGLSGHAEMEGKTLFLKANTGASGHGAPMAAGQAFALKYAGCEDVKVFMLEGEGGLTPGVVQETKNSAYGLGLGNFINIIDWNDYGIDDRKFSDVIYGTPEDWYSSCGWKVAGAENGESFDEIMQSYNSILEADSNTPKAIYVKTRKGRGYGKYDNKSHGAAHPRNSEAFWKTKQDFSEKHNITFSHLNKPDCSYEENKIQMQTTLDEVFSLFEKEEGLLDYLSNRLIELGESIPEKKELKEKLSKNPQNDENLYDYEKYPFYLKPGDAAPNSKGLFAFGSWINNYCQKNYNRPLFFGSSADLAGSTNIAGFGDIEGLKKDTPFYDRNNNNKGVILPQAITEFANAGIMTGISSVNFSEKPFNNFNGFLSASSTYGSFSYLKYGIFRIFSQMAQDSNLKLGKTLWISGHSGPETASDSRTHFGIFSPGVSKLFPKGHIINLHPWEFNEVPVVLAASLKSNIPIIALHLTRPPITIPDRKALKMASHFDAAKGAYIIRDYNSSKPKEGVVIIRGSKATETIVSMLSKIEESGPNIKIVAAISSELFDLQNKNYKNSILTNQEYLDSMVITNTAINLMDEWIHHPIIKEYSLSPDFDNRWRTGGTLEEILNESHLSEKFQWEAIRKFAKDREKRKEIIQSQIWK